MSAVRCTHTHGLMASDKRWSAPTAYLLQQLDGGAKIQHVQPAIGCVSSLLTNADRVQVVEMLVLDGHASLVALVAEDALPSLGDLLCDDHHDQCQSIECDSESGD